MAAVDDVQKDGFSFTWTIQNFSYCAGTSVTSPKFVTSEILDAKWCLILNSERMGGSCSIAINLKLLSFDYGPVQYYSSVNFEVSICTPMGIFEQNETQNKQFCIGSENGINSTILLQDLYKNKREFNDNNDSLTIRCRILKMTYLQHCKLGFRRCHARTIILIERTTSLLNLQNFQEEFNKRKPKREPIEIFEKSSFTMEITSSGAGIAEEKIVIEIKRVDSEDKFCLFSTCKISLIGINEKIVYSVKDEHRFESENIQVWKVALIPMDKLLKHKEIYLPNGTLTLRCEFAVSSGATYHELKTNDCEIADLNLLENCKQEKDVDVPRSLNDNLKCFYIKEKFTDLKIQTPTKEFPVHKTILCARSDVFSAMFESDTKEKLTGVIEIKDIYDDTVSKMLLFMYTDSVGEELDFEMAFTLYSAADKYGIVVLREKCADFLKGNLTMNNVCDVLVLAVMHEDQELKMAAQNFIFENRGEMMDSEEWSKLMQNHVQLASKTMRSFLRKC